MKLSCGGYIRQAGCLRIHVVFRKYLEAKGNPDWNAGSVKNTFMDNDKS